MTSSALRVSMWHGSRGLRLDLQRLELVKWVALGLMIGDHVNAYLFDGGYPVLYAAGRLAFPLFAFALALGVAHHSPASLTATLRRLFVCAVAAQPWAFLVRGDAHLTVLVTLLLGLAIDTALRARVRVSHAVVLIAGATALGALCEFSFLGVWFVALACRAARVRTGAAQLAAVGALGLLYAVNGTNAALFAVPLLGVLLALPVVVVRVRYWFYGAYVMQFPLFLVLRWAL